MPSKDKPQNESTTFEASLTRLETIVKEMESGSLSLDEMLARFEEGSALVKQCGQKLNDVEQKIEVLIRKGDELGTEPFEPESAGRG